MTVKERRRLEAIREKIPQYQGPEGRELFKGMLIEHGWIKESTRELSSEAVATICQCLLSRRSVPVRGNDAKSLTSIRDLIKFYYAEWARARRDYPGLLLPTETPPRVTQYQVRLLQRMVSEVGCEAVKAGITALVTSYDRWIATSTDRSISVLWHCRYHLIPKYQSARSQQESELRQQINKGIRQYIGKRYSDATR